MSSLAVNHIRALVSCDAKDTVYEDVNLLCEDGLITYIGPERHEADTVIDGSGMFCYPGLVNAHHHLYQVFSRNLPKVQNMELFDWLKTLYEIWKNLNADTIRLSSLTGMGELMKNGCTTVFDHHYVFPRNAGDLIGAQAAAADLLGIRMHFSRGSMDLSVKDGGLPPDSVVQTIDEILEDSIRLIDRYHDTSRRFPYRRICCGSLPRLRGKKACGCTRICARRWTKKNTCLSGKGSGRWPIWKSWAGSGRTYGMPTGSTSTMRSWRCWRRRAPGSATARFPT